MKERRGRGKDGLLMLLGQDHRGSVDSQRQWMSDEESLATLLVYLSVANTTKAVFLLVLLPSCAEREPSVGEPVLQCTVDFDVSQNLLFHEQELSPMPLTTRFPYGRSRLHS